MALNDWDMLGLALWGIRLLVNILLMSLEGIYVCLHGDIGLDDLMWLGLPPLSRLSPGDEDVLMPMAY